MIVTRICINVFSELNPWIDFCILVDEMQFNKAKEIVEKAWDDWWDDDCGYDEPIADYISSCLTDNGIEHEIYFSDDNEEEE